MYSLLELCSVSQLSQSSGLLSAYSQLTLSSARLEHEGDALAAADARYLVITPPLAGLEHERDALAAADARYLVITPPLARLEHERDALAAADARRAHGDPGLAARDGVGEAGGGKG